MRMSAREIPSMALLQSLFRSTSTLPTQHLQFHSLLPGPVSHGSSWASAACEKTPRLAVRAPIVARTRPTKFSTKQSGPTRSPSHPRRCCSSFSAHPRSKTADLILVDGQVPDKSLPEVKQICDQLWMIPDFITEEQEAKLVEEINPLFKKKRYVDTHWDGVITGYKEIEKSFWVKPENLMTIQQVKSLFPANTQWLPGVHVLDLAANGPIDAHIDSVTAFGGILAGLSLLSRCVMTLKRPGHKPIQMRLEPRSLYVMQGPIRYDYTHEIPANESKWLGESIPRERRISIMFRDKLLSKDGDEMEGVRVFKLNEDGTTMSL